MGSKFNVKKLMQSIMVDGYVFRSKIESLDLDDEKFEELLNYISENNIKVKEDIQDDIEMYNDEKKEITEYIQNDSVQEYLQEISKIPLLDIDEEKELARLIAQGDKIAEHKLIKSNLRLVVSIAKKYVHRGLPFLDLIQDGNMGLMKAVTKYDLEKGFKFSTYATWWIRQNITRSLAINTRIIKYPLHVGEKLNKIKKIYFQYSSIGYEPSKIDVIVKQELGITEEKLYEYKKLIDNDFIISVEQKLNFEDGTSTVGDFIRDETKNTEEAALESLEADDLNNLLKHLNEKERFVLEHRYGLGNKEPKTLEELGKMVGITRERVRQIEAKALRRLRSIACSRIKRENFDNYRYVYKK